MNTTRSLCRIPETVSYLGHARIHTCTHVHTHLSPYTSSWPLCLLFFRLHGLMDETRFTKERKSGTLFGSSVYNNRNVYSFDSNSFRFIKQLRGHGSFSFLTPRFSQTDWVFQLEKSKTPPSTLSLSFSRSPPSLYLSFSYGVPVPDFLVMYYFGLGTTIETGTDM